MIKMKDIKVEIDSKVPGAMDAFNNAVRRALFAMGENGTTRAQQYITQEGRIDTGLMRASITHQEHKDFVVIGTNVFYAVYQELGTSRGIKPALFLTRAITNHVDEYRKLIIDSLKNA